MDDAYGVLDKGYHHNGLLDFCRTVGMRTYIPERKQKNRRWTDKPAGYEQSFRANRRRVRSAKGKRLNRLRSELCERSFAHVCETGGGRRSWLRGLVNVTKSHVLRCAAFNLGLLLRKVFGLGKPRSLRAAVRTALFALLAFLQHLRFYRSIEKLPFFNGLLASTLAGYHWLALATLMLNS